MDNQKIQEHVQTVREVINDQRPTIEYEYHLRKHRNLHQTSIEIIEQQQREISDMDREIEQLELEVISRPSTEEYNAMYEENERLRSVLTIIAEEEYPYAPMTDHSCLRFFIDTARQALPPKEATNG